jgi:general secretion pathway protein M
MSDKADGGLPEGRRGQALAVALVVVLATLVWLGIGSPLITWYEARSTELSTRQSLLDHMAERARALPALRRLAAATRTAAAAPDALLTGDSDAIAAATLQGMIEDMATTAGATLASEEVLPAVQQGAFRQISLRIALSGRWPVLIGLLRAIDASDLRLLVDDLEFHALADGDPNGGQSGGGTGGGGGIGGHAAMDMSFVVTALRSAAADGSPDDLQAQASER